ncbi:MAG TPA: ATP-binding protein [Syntrophorhabdaceae bacterium]|nr:ATP-binding protein [Syntrophorhabdaceae bacterium]HPU28692.1 ATP-binding protein [Syntrophorhabdaceae bacterium]
MKTIQLLGEIIEISNSNLEINSRMQAILNIISHRMEFEEVLVFKLDKDKRLTCSYANEKSRLYPIVNKYRCHIGEGVIGTVAQKRVPQYFNHNDIPPRFGCIFFNELDDVMYNYRSFAFIPVSDDSFLYGVLVVISRSMEGIKDNDKILLAIIAREIGGLLKTNDLLINSKKRISELVTLSELGKILTTNLEPQTILKNTVFTIAKALNAVFASINIDWPIPKMECHRFVYGNLNGSLAEIVEDCEKQAIQQKKTITYEYYNDNNDLQVKKIYSLYSSPILTKNKAIGVLTIGFLKPGKNFYQNEDMLYITTTITNYIANGLENILLSTKLKEVIKELNETQKRVIEQEKFKSLGEMMANIAHEIKNPLVVIGGFTKRLAKKVNLSQTENRYANIIVSEVARLESILNDVLNYVKEPPPILDECNINACIEDILYLFTSDGSWEGIKITKDLDPSLPLILCDVQQMKQVFINMILNSFEAMNGKGEITIQTKNIADDENHPQIMISISDTGGGIDPTIIENIFNPFFTTKEKGTGLGLAISNKIVKNIGGRIEIENIVGKGVTFKIYLPVNKNKNNGEV